MSDTHRVSDTLQALRASANPYQMHQVRSATLLQRQHGIDDMAGVKRVDCASRVVMKGGTVAGTDGGSVTTVILAR